MNPSSVTTADMPSLEKLLDGIFMEGVPGKMTAMFPQLFAEENRENLWIYRDGSEVCAHAGMLFRSVQIGGCLLPVACVGAVATASSWRGKGLASELMDILWKRACASGAVIMMISGERSLYRRLGAAAVGVAYEAVVSMSDAEAFRQDEGRLRPADVSDLSAMNLLYTAKKNRFLRIPSDWRLHFDSPLRVSGERRFYILEKEASMAGYFIVSMERKEHAPAEIIEFAGDAALLVGALARLMEAVGRNALTIRLEEEDTLIRDRLYSSGMALQRVSVQGSWAVLHWPRLIEAVSPWIRERLGDSAPMDATIDGEGNYTLSLLGERARMTPSQAIWLLFGGAEYSCPHPVWEGIFPLPVVGYGLDFI